jgi:O-antigen/teichoic acid export membrane protein
LASKQFSRNMGSVFRQSSALLAGNIFLLMGGYGFKIYLARTVGAEGLGLFALGESLMAFALIGSVWSLDQTVFRFIPQFKASHEAGRLQRIIWASIWHVLFWSVLTGAVLWATRNFWADWVFKNRAFAGALVFFALMLPARALTILVRMIARSYKEVFRVVVIQAVIAFPIKVLLSVALIAGGWGLAGWLTGEACAYVLSALLLGWLAFHLTPKEAQAPILALRLEPAVYSFAGTMIGRTLLGTANSHLGIFLLGIFLTTREVGIYSVSFTMITVMGMLQGAMNGAFSPHIPELYALGRIEELVEMYYRITRWNLIAALPLFVLYLIMAQPIMGVFGEEFTKGALVLSALAVGQMVNVGAGPVGLLLTMTGSERAVLWVLAAQLAITAALLFLLLPVFGLLGAGVAWSIGTAAFFLGLYGYAKKIFPLYLYNFATLRLLISAGALMVCGLGLMHLLSAWCRPTIMLIGACIGLYLIWGVWVFFGVLDQQDKEFVGEALRGVRARFVQAVG